MRAFAVTLISGLAAAMLLIWWADPANRCSDRLKAPQTAYAPNEVWLNPLANFNYRKIRFSQIAVNARPEVVFLGSSRVMRIRSPMLKSDETMLNLGVDSPKPVDMIAFWQSLSDHHKRPRFAVLGIDPYTVNAVAPERAYGVIAEYNAEFLESIGGPHPSRPPAILTPAVWTYGFSVVDELLQWKEFVYALRFLKRYGLHRPQGEIRPEHESPSESIGIRGDGSLFQKDDDPSLLTPEAIRSAIDQPNGTSLVRWRQDDQAIDHLKTLLIAMRQSGTEPMLVLLPYHPIALEAIRHHAKSESALRAYRQAIAGLGGEATSTPVCDAVDPQTIGCSASEFGDWFHMKESCAEKLLQFCFSSRDNWKNLLPPLKS